MRVYTDLRAIVMEKSMRREDMPMSCPPGRWMMLGHMDWLRVEQIDTRNACSTGACLDQVKTYSQHLSVSQAGAAMYSQPLYVLREFPDEQRTYVEAFWNQPAAFMTVTRVHSKGQSQERFESAITAQLNNAEKKNCNPVFPYDAHDESMLGSKLGKRVIYLYYRSLELSDVVLITKSDSVEALLSCIGRLFTLEAAGDIYSYYCISGSMVDYVVDDDRIPLISTRFAVRSAAVCHAQIEMLQQMFPGQDGNPSSAFFITGMEDINLITYDASSRKMRDIFQKILSMGDAFRQAFDDSTTRLGIEETYLHFGSSERGDAGSEQDLILACEKLRDSYIALYKEHQFERDWVRPLMELLNMLYHMSTNCVLRQVCYTLLNGLRGMIHCVQEQFCSKDFSAKRDKEIMQIVTGIDQLMEHIIRMEGELVHHPETRPMLFDIPVNLLEFYLLFSDQSIRYFQSREARQRECDYQILLIPNLCEEISIHDRLNKQRSANRLLFVEIPLGLIYSPFSVVCKLVHEVAHYGGETARNRELRFSCLINCSAHLLADELGIGGSDTAFRMIRNQILNNYPKDKKLYMWDIIDCLSQTTNQIGQAELYVEEFWDAYLNESEFTPDEKMAWLSERIVNYRHKKGERLEKKLDKVLWEIESLFKETYADLAMLTLLGLCAKDYIRILEESEWPGATSSEVSFACKIERAALVLCAIDEENLLDISSCLSSPLARNIHTYCRVWQDETGDITALPSRSGNYGYHNCEIADIILLYLKECCRMIRDYDDEEGNRMEREKIQDNFRRFAQEQRFASLEFFQTIEDYRPRLIDRNFITSITK